MSHSFDQALQLAWQGEDLFTGHTHPAWANMVGPYGGISAACALQAVMQHPLSLGEPVALTINYAAGLADGPYHLKARPARTNRSTQHWVLEWLQDIDGQAQVMMTATALTAVRRGTWRAQDLPLPEVPPPEAVPAVLMVGQVEWVNRYEMRVLRGHLPEPMDGREQDSLMQMWLRDAEHRPVDLPALAAMTDVFYPRVWLRRAHRVPAGTVSLTIYFHAGGQELAEQGHEPLLAQARSHDFRYGFFDQTSQLWSRRGLLLATAHQIVYYKE
jgi:acyl-CoA thioesterase